MGYNDLLTKNGHQLSVMSNLLQKAIRRGNPDLAGYAANEMFGRYNGYLWKRLIMISAEDCYGVITKEVMALKEADDYWNGAKKGYERDKMFVAKALTLLLFCKKNRDACYLACNHMLSEKVLDENMFLDLDTCTYDGKLPDYCIDCHSYEGKRRGKTVAEFIETEDKALGTGVGQRQPGIFDGKPWDKFMETVNERGGYGVIDEEKGTPMPDQAILRQMEKNGWEEPPKQCSLFDGL